jgi:undecaprenyl-diphosphatase
VAIREQQLSVAREGRNHRAALVARASGTASNLARWAAALIRRPAEGRARPFVWPAPGRLALWCALTIVAVAAAMWMLDPWAGTYRASLPPWFVLAGETISDLAKGDWVLLPFGAALIAIAAVASPALGRITYGVLLSLAARCGFVVLAIGLPGITVSVVKRLIGRARPGRFEGSDLHFAPFSWSSSLASFPSGHSTTAFAAAVALGALFPRARAALFAYAALMALSRVVVAAHYPSDVIAGAVVGSCGALLVRVWFASRGLGFFISSAGRVERRRGPSRRRIARAMRGLLTGRWV